MAKIGVYPKTANPSNDFPGKSVHTILCSFSNFWRFPFPSFTRKIVSRNTVESYFINCKHFTPFGQNRGYSEIKRALGFATIFIFAITLDRCHAISDCSRPLQKRRYIEIVVTDFPETRNGNGIKRRSPWENACFFYFYWNRLKIHTNI